MSFSRREILLVAATSAVVVGLLSWFITIPMRDSISKSYDQQIKLRKGIDKLQKLIALRGPLTEQLETLRAQLPRFKPDRQVSAEIISEVKKIADENALTLPRLEAEPEKAIGDLYEIAIECSWEGTLESITHFLYAVQGQGAMLDIRQLNVQPAQNTTQAGRLRGNFKLFYAFMREKAGGVKVNPAPPAALNTNALSPSAAATAPEAVAPVVRLETNKNPVAAVPISTNATAAGAGPKPPGPPAGRLPKLPGMPKMPGQ